MQCGVGGPRQGVLRYVVWVLLPHHHGTSCQPGSSWTYPTCKQHAALCTFSPCHAACGRRACRPAPSYSTAVGLPHSSKRVQHHCRQSSRTPEAATTSSSSNSSTSSAAERSGEASTSGRFNPQVTTWDDDAPHESSYYDWKWGSKISYVRAGRSGPPLLLCHGFGVGSYHFSRNISVLAQNHRVSWLSKAAVLLPWHASSCVRLSLQYRPEAKSSEVCNQHVNS